MVTLRCPGKTGACPPPPGYATNRRGWRRTRLVIIARSFLSLAISVASESRSWESGGGGGDGGFFGLWSGPLNRPIQRIGDGDNGGWSNITWSTGVRRGWGTSAPRDDTDLIYESAHDGIRITIYALFFRSFYIFDAAARGCLFIISFLLFNRRSLRASPSLEIEKDDRWQSRKRCWPLSIEKIVRPYSK